MNEHYKKEIEKIQEEIKSKKDIRWKKVKDIIMRSNFNLYFWYYTKPIEDFSTKENYDKYRGLLKQNITEELNLELNIDETLDFFINDLLEETIDEFISFIHFENINLISSILNEKISSKDRLYKRFIDEDFYSALNKKYNQEISPIDTIGIIEGGIKNYKKKFHLRKRGFLKNFLKDIKDDLHSI